MNFYNFDCPFDPKTIDHSDIEHDTTDQPECRRTDCDQNWNFVYEKINLRNL